MELERGQEGKRIYSIEQMLALRPLPTSQLCPAAAIFLPRASRYTCYERAVSLGFADPPVCMRPVLSAAAREFCARVHLCLV